MRLPIYIITMAIGSLPGKTVFSVAGAGLVDFMAKGGDFDVGSVLRAEVLDALIGFASLSLAAMLNKARFAKSSEAYHANPSLA